MDYKKAIDNTLSDMNGSFHPMSNAEFSRKVQERAEIMSSNETNADTTLLEKEVGYKPHVRLHEGIAAFAAWYNSDKNPLK